MDKNTPTKQLKFAVIEYGSKSGKIWKHTPEQPNFLADPQREIDPTSFGCYVSALHGEHIPLTGMITGSLNHITPAIRFRRKVIKKLTGHWPQDYPLERLKDYDVLMVVHQISDGSDITRFAKRLKKTYPNIFILGVPTQPFGVLKEYWAHHPWWFKHLRSFMDTCDAFMTVVKDTQQEWQELTTTPVEYLPQPYPVEYALRYFRQPESKEKVIFVAGITERDNIQQGHIVARQLQREFPSYIIHVTKTPGASLDLSKLSGARYKVVSFKQWRKHLVTLSKSMLVINTDYTLTRGRVQMDCAAVGTPSIGSNSDGQRDLFPSLAATPETLVDDIVEQGRRMLANQKEYRKAVAYAREKLPLYNYTNSAQRIHELVARHQAQKEG